MKRVINDYIDENEFQESIILREDYNKSGFIYQVIIYHKCKCGSSTEIRMCPEITKQVIIDIWNNDFELSGNCICGVSTLIEKAPNIRKRLELYYNKEVDGYGEIYNLLNEPDNVIHIF